jgi:hypothetical protein
MNFFVWPDDYLTCSQTTRSFGNLRNNSRFATGALRIETALGPKADVMMGIQRTTPWRAPALAGLKSAPPFAGSRR